MIEFVMGLIIFIAVLNLLGRTIRWLFCLGIVLVQLPAELLNAIKSSTGRERQLWNLVGLLFGLLALLVLFFLFMEWLIHAVGRV